MRRPLIILFAVFSVMFGTVSSGQEPARLALLIGNQGYTDAVGPLKNPHNDMTVVGRALGDVGFKLQEPVKDGTRDDMLFAVHELAAALRKAGRGAIGFFYYTGHGIAVGGDNVLIPKNARGTSDAELNVRGVKLAEILDILKRDAPDAVHFVVLDACRNNIRGQRGSKGFAPVNDQRTGVVLAFATAAGETASDEGATSGPYAAALAEEIVKPGRNDQSVFNAVRSRVVSATRTQTPWIHDGLIGERVVFKAATTVPPGPSVVAPPPQTFSTAAREWQDVKDTTSVAVLERYGLRHKDDPVYAALAQGRIEVLKHQQLVDAAKQAEAARKKAEDDVRAKAQAEENRLAALSPPAVPPHKQHPEESIQLARSIQIELKRVGCDPGSTNGTWGLMSRRAATDFARRTKFGALGDSPSHALLQHLLDQKTRVCRLDCGADQIEVGGKCVARVPPIKKPVPAASEEKSQDRQKEAHSSQCGTWNRCASQIASTTQSHFVWQSTLSSCGVKPAGC